MLSDESATVAECNAGILAEQDAAERDQRGVFLRPQGSYFPCLRVAQGRRKGVAAALDPWTSAWRSPERDSALGIRRPHIGDAWHLPNTRAVVLSVACQNWPRAARSSGSRVGGEVAVGLPGQFPGLIGDQRVVDDPRSNDDAMGTRPVAVGSRSDPAACSRSTSPTDSTAWPSARISSMNATINGCDGRVSPRRRSRRCTWGRCLPPTDGPRRDSVIPVRRK